MECGLAGGVKVDARGRHPHLRGTKAPHFLSEKKKEYAESVAG